MKLIDKLFEDKLDIIGDVHGEIEALNNLLSELGYAEDGSHKNSRRLVFVGDLVDRGPDSPAVVERVMELVNRGAAQCVLGNHELNLLLGLVKKDNHWFSIPDDSDEHPAELVSQEQQKSFLEFFAQLPLALENSRIRVAHACWHPESIARLRQDQALGLSVVELHERYRQTIEQDLESRPVWGEFQNDKQVWKNRLTDDCPKPDMLNSFATIDSEHQMRNPIKVVTSGVEVPAREPFPAGGKWRFVGRRRWWDDTSHPEMIVIGHYWRNVCEGVVCDEKRFGPCLFDGIPPNAWMGTRNRVYCIDFSVGSRPSERGKNQEFTGKLSAFRYPEEEVMHDDGSGWKVGRA